MKWKQWIALILALLLLTGCAAPNTDTQPTSAPTESTAAPTTVATTEPPLVLQGANKLLTHKNTSGVELSVVDSRTVLLVTGSYVGEGFATYQTQLCLTDIFTDTVLAEATLEGEYTPVTSYTDSIAMACEKEGHIILLDHDLQRTATLEVKEQEGILATDEAYYYIHANDLYRMDTATGEATQIRLERELPLVELQSYDVQRNLLMCTAFVDPYTVGTCCAVIDLNTNAFVFLSSAYTTGNLTQNGVLLKGEEDLFKADMAYGLWENECLYGLEEFFVNDGKISSWHIPGTDYIYRITYDRNQLDVVEKAELFRAGEAFEVCQLPAPLDDVKAKEVLPLPDGNLLVLAVNRRVYELYLICPELLEFTPAVTPESQTLAYVDETVYETYEKAETREAVAPELAQVRQDADELEEEYGITILISNQCAAAVKSSGMTVTTTDQAQLQDEAAWIDSALDQLEEVLQLYPEGYFRQFQNESGQKGMMILLIGGITDELNVIGYCYTMGDWSFVTVDITSGEVYQTYCHEFWHAAEFKMEKEDPWCFDDDIWNQYNPEGYAYSYDSTPGYINDLEHTLYNNETNDNIYFIDPYAKTEPYEDRARLMEYVMCSDFYAKQIAQIPALSGKLKLMSEAIRKHFDTTGWGELHWERYSK